MTIQSEINQVDLALVVDTTGSMGNLIRTAKSTMTSTLETLSQGALVDLHVGVVEYRDHPPQDTALLTRVHVLTGEMTRVQRTISALTADGGGDEPEAVLDGIAAACREIKWRTHSRRLLFLIGDAPPHGTGYPRDGFASGCPCGETIESITALAEEHNVTIYALGLTGLLEQSFSQLATMTGGTYFSAPASGAHNAIERMASMLRGEFSNLDLDRKVLTYAQGNPAVSIESLSETLGQTRAALSASWVRLCSRGFLREVARS